MSKLAIVNNLTRSFHKTGFKIKKHSPEILIAAGVVGTVASTIMACKATLKVDEIKAEAKEKIDKIHAVFEEGHDEYTQEDYKKDLTIVYTQTGLKFVKLYAPAVITGTLALASILTSHKILRTRNIALAAAYATVDRSFKDYRGRVVERFGEELDRELKYDIKAKKIEEKVINEDGTESTVEKTVNVAYGIDDDPNSHSDYARFFDDGCLGWEKDPEQNLYTLKCVQNYANDKLKSDGRLFLNDVYEMLGIPKTKAGQVVGWVYDEKNPIGDNFVDFGIYDYHRTKARDFVNGYEPTILLDFNVDGNVWELMK